MGMSQSLWAAIGFKAGKGHESWSSARPGAYRLLSFLTSLLSHEIEAGTQILRDSSSPA